MMNLKQYATKEKPTQEGYYLWWDEDEDIRPFHVLAAVKMEYGELLVNFDLDSDYDNYIRMCSVADRLWLKVSD